MLLDALLDDYLLEHDIATGSARNMRQAVDSYSEFIWRECQRESSIDDLTAKPVNSWLVGLVAKNKRTTASSYRGRLLTLWRYAYQIELVNEWPSRVRRIKTDRPLPDSWSDDEVARMIVEASRYKGNLCSPRAQGISRAGYLVSLIAIVHAAGNRYEDLIRFGWENLRGNNLAWVQHKTGKPLSRPIPEWVVALINRTFSKDRPAWFGGVISYNRMRLYFVQITERAGVTGTYRKLRRTSGNAVEEKYPGFGHRHLGNTPAVFQAHYADPSRLSLAAPSPDPLPPPV